MSTGPQPLTVPCTYVSSELQIYSPVKTKRASINTSAFELDVPRQTQKKHFSHSESLSNSASSFTSHSICRYTLKALGRPDIVPIRQRIQKQKPREVQCLALGTYPESGLWWCTHHSNPGTGAHCPAVAWRGALEDTSSGKPSWTPP